jgi:hypothetical protein
MGTAAAVGQGGLDLLPEWGQNSEVPEWDRWSDERKHRPIAGATRDEIIAATARGPSRYFETRSIRSIEEQVARWGFDVPSGHSPTVARVLSFDVSIGASKGKESRWAYVESTSGSFHGYPISEEEYDGLLEIADDEPRDSTGLDDPR